MLGHLRGFFFVDFPNLTHPSIGIRCFYFVSGLGHQGVVIFFVLSGCLVGGSVVQAWQKGCFTWVNYTVTRLSRLWTVLIPALLWTYLLDNWGRLKNPAAYLGALREYYHSGPSPLKPTSHGFETLLSNLFFLQGITAPTFGTNGPLWSLTNEFWYYVLFPAGLLAFGALASGLRQPKTRRVFLLHALIFTLLVAFLPAHVLKAGVTWLLGVAVWWWRSRPEKSSPPSSNTLPHLNLPRILFQAATLFGFGVTVFGARFGKSWGSDLAVGISFAAFLGTWKSFKLNSRRISSILFWGSEISYSLYLFHFPLLFFISAGLLGGEKWQPGAVGFGLLLLLSVMTIGASACAWWLFERHTPAVRAFLMRGLAPSFGLRRG